MTSVRTLELRTRSAVPRAASGATAGAAARPRKGQSGVAPSIFRASTSAVRQANASTHAASTTPDAKRMPEITPLELKGPAGRLQAELLEPAAAPAFTATVAHPHPLYGGDMDNHVVTTAADAVAELGGAALRFNFRGTGGSEGRHDAGRGETDDLAACEQELRRRYPRLPRVGIGYSFGAVVTMARLPQAEAAQDPPRRAPAHRAAADPLRLRGGVHRLRTRRRRLWPARHVHDRRDDPATTEALALAGRVPGSLRRRPRSLVAAAGRDDPPGAAEPAPLIPAGFAHWVRRRPRRLPRRPRREAAAILPP